MAACPAGCAGLPTHDSTSKDAMHRPTERPTGPQGSSAGLDAGTWLDDHGDALFRYAWSRLGRRDQAEDLVQETLLAALRARDDFRGVSSVRTWLLGILKRKLVDQYRKGRAGDAARDANAGRTPIEDRVFDTAGSFRQTPSRWGSPSDALERGELREILAQCLGRLPGRFAAAFTLREVEGLTSTQICEFLGMSPGNLRVLLHRARLSLRECLEQNWFAPQRRGT
jgi:RNA polymerase sigma-70 factor (ECF subfamily)